LVLTLAERSQAFLASLEPMGVNADDHGLALELDFAQIARLPVGYVRLDERPL
jgi:hypothetical protein